VAAEFFVQVRGPLRGQRQVWHKEHRARCPSRSCDRVGRREPQNLRTKRVCATEVAARVVARWARVPTPQRL